jgi:virulence-associated protein VagC
MRYEMKVKVTEAGVVIPKKLLLDVEEVEIRKEYDIIIVYPISKTDPIFEFGTDPVSCGAPDASENLDKYLYSAVS